jgi:uncharacterized membrane protein
MTPEPLAGAPLQIVIHLCAAVLSALVGAVIFLNRKGTRFHKTLGWSFVVLMAITAISAIFIRSAVGLPNIAGFTPIHLFVVLTGISLPAGLYLIRRGKVRAHATTMISLYIGAIVVAGVLAFLPGRILNRMVFGG